MKMSAPTVGMTETMMVGDVLYSGWLTNGPVVQEFEAEYARKTGWKHVIAVNSATMGAQILFDGLGLKGNMKQVVVPALTFASPVIQLLKRGVEVLVTDVDENTLCMAEPNWKLGKDAWIMPTDYAGFSRLYPQVGGGIIRDSAAYYGPKPTDGTQYAFTSFYANKVMTTGEGGAILTQDDALAEYARMARLHGISIDAHGRENKARKELVYDIEFLGEKGNMSDINAAVGVAQLDRVDDFVKARRHLATLYAAYLPHGVITQFSTPTHPYCMYVVRFPDEAARDRVRAKLALAEIPTSLHYPLLTELTALQGKLTVMGPLTVAENARKTMLSLPMHPGLTEADVARVCEVIKAAL